MPIMRGLLPVLMSILGVRTLMPFLFSGPFTILAGREPRHCVQISFRASSHVLNNYTINLNMMVSLVSSIMSETVWLV